MPSSTLSRHSSPTERGEPTLRTSTPRQELVARVIVWAYALAAVMSLFLWLVERWGRRHASWVELTFTFLNLPVSNSLVSVVILALMTRALLGRKRIGLIAVAFFEVVGVLIGLQVLYALMSGHRELHLWGDWRFLGPLLDLGAIVPAVLILWVCWWVRPAFPGRLRPGSWATLVLTIFVGLGLAALVAGLMLSFFDSDATDPGVVRSIVLHALGFSGLWARSVTSVPPIVSQVAALIVSATIVLAVYLFTRSTRNRTGWTQDGEVTLRRLLREYGDLDSLGYFATRRDKSLVFAQDGRAVVAYDVVAGVALASGDPLGDPSSWADAIQRWKAQARWYGWVPAIIGVSEAGARAYITAGFDVVSLGDEAVLRPDTYRINNTSMTGLRRSVHHARRAGLTTQIRRQGEIPEIELAELVAMADAWREGGTERGFSMALDRRGDAADGRVVWVTAHDPEGKCYGLLSFVPWGATGLSLDTMRRHPQAPNGTTELLVTALMEAGPDIGVRRVSLNFAFLRGVFVDAEQLGAGVITRFNSSVLGGLDRFFQLERLYRANQKFEPSWVPRFVCLDSRLSMPQVLVAMGKAEGFLPTFLHRHHPGRLDAEHLAEVREIDARPAIDAASLAPRRGDQTRVRLDRVARLRAEGHDPYAIGVAPAEKLSTVTALPAQAWDDATGTSVRIYGRVRAVRDHGGVIFVDLVDGEDRVQMLFDRARLDAPEGGQGAQDLRSFTHAIDGGDILVVDGRPGRSRTGTPSVLVDSWRIVAKALHPIPFGAFTDPEARLRQRSTDLIVHPEAVRMLRVRSAVVRSLRDTLHDAGYLEVETPILHTVHGGASARPFKTFSNAYGVDLSMRIAPELYLKRLMVAGMGPLFEMGRNFRNEGADATHNPEFTSLEAYEPFGDYTTMRHLTERLVKEAATAVHGSAVIPLRTTIARGGEGTDEAVETRELVDVSGEWPVVTVLDAVSQAVGREVRLDTDFETLLDLARRHEIAVHDGMGPGAVIEELYAELVEATTTFPTFYVDFPVETSPLTGPHRSEPGLVERWDLVVDGMELGTAYSELTDPIEQRRRLTEQSLKAALGDLEAMEVDESFLRALETGMPPAGGLGIGVDRLAMLLIGTNIRGVLTFPFVRPLGRG
ncbi:bifunctional lysylphosphatidylglycerol synthetase/lysine--tRNA ligase LysX [Mobilicoccus massiliensis]|uniref:bifunctional lysylphosphatidylglycerol synthetase/lysine--tRNA ligase LysX n=1 Tax=Mobilicoccus massiliensis TaxID=1522310 RepID=UPI0009E343BD|nr:bifunctional lysylphosphatidylglycerol synthetase/lysine--tRNA ligase LysX [Mobilicoccus massiliensis]